MRNISQLPIFNGNGKRRPSPIILKKLSSIYNIDYNDLLSKAGFAELVENKKEDNFRYASNNGLDTEGLTDEEIEELKEFIRFKKSLKKKKDQIMEVLDLYNLTEKEKIDIIDYKWSKAKARIFEENNEYSIGIDYRKIANSIEEKEILAEELGHYYCRCFILH